MATTHGQRRSARRARTAAPFVEAKIGPPRRMRLLVDRPRIVDALEAGRDAALTLIAAPVGYGKTTAASTWVEHDTAHVAWVTLDAGDDDPVRLWTYVATAVDRVRRGVGDAALRQLGVAGAPVEGAVDELMNGVAALGDDLTIVLDDVHLVTDREALRTLDSALDHLPGRARIIAIARSDPAIGLARLRARGRLLEIRAPDLAFTRSEVGELLVERLGVPIDRGETRALFERTEGWPAAVFLAGLWLRQVDDVSRAVREFGASHRFVADYLSHEVLGVLGDDLRDFLLRIAVLGEFTAGLCDEALDRAQSAGLIEELERRQIFVTPLGAGGWFRLHPLLGEFARLELAALDPGAATEIHRRAADWFRRQGLVAEAANHAAQAGDDRLEAEIVADAHLTLIRSGESRTMIRLAQGLPEARLRERPRIAAAAATALTLVGGRAAERRRFLAVAAGSNDLYTEAAVAMVRAATVDGGVEAAVAEGRRAVEIAREHADEVLVAALAAHARALYFAGDGDAACGAATEAVVHPDAEVRAPGHALARTTLALVQADSGRTGLARRQAEVAKSVVGRLASTRTWLGANVSAALGSLLAAEGRLAEAERHLAAAARFFEDEFADVHHAWLLLQLARNRCRRGRLVGARQALASAREELADLSDPGRLAFLAVEVDRELEDATARAAAGEVLAQPSRAELAVLRLLPTDLTVREIAAELYLSPNTVHTHLRSVYRKLAVSSRADAVARASSLGLIA